MRAVVLSLALLAGGCATSAQDTADRSARSAREFADATKGRVPGKPQECLDSIQASGPQVIAPDTLVYRDVGRVWTTKIEGCNFLDWNSLIVAELRSGGNRICRNDRFQAVQRGTAGIPGPWCRFQTFTPWEKPKG